MDRPKPIEIDWEAVDKLIEEYDAGDITIASSGAKMLKMAFNEGYEKCMAEQEEAQANLMIMLSTPSGNA